MPLTAATAAVALAAAVAAWAWYLCFYRPKRVMRHFAKYGIPSKPFVPVLGQLAEMDQVMKAKGDAGMLQYWIDNGKELGRNFVFCVGPQPYVLLSDPDYYRDIFTVAAERYHKTTETNKSLLRPMLGNGLLLSEGEFHRTQRDSVEPFFHHVSLASLVPLMVECADGLVRRWREAAARGAEVEIHHALAEVGLDVVGTAAFGRPFRDDPAASAAFTDAMLSILDGIRERLLISMIPVLNRLPVESLRRFRGHCAVIRGTVANTIARRRAEPPPPADSPPRDLLDMLLRSQMPEGQLLDECVNFMGAGSETTSNLMTWLLYHLVRRPDLWQRCVDEVARVLPGGAAPTYETVRQMPFLEACAYEALRLNAPAPAINKLAVEDHHITVGAGADKRQVFVPAGTNFLVHGQMVHRGEADWPDPERFNPERFLAGPSGPSKADPALRHPFSWVGFSHGPRKCLGKNFAMLEIKVVMVRLMQNLSFEVAPGQVIVPDSSSQAPKHGIRLIVRQEPVAPSAGPRVGGAGAAGQGSDAELVRPVGMI